MRHKAAASGACLHGVGLAGSCLPVGEDGAIEALQDLLHDGLDGPVVQFGLRGVRVEHLAVAAVTHPGYEGSGDPCPLMISQWTV